MTADGLVRFAPGANLSALTLSRGALSAESVEHLKGLAGLKAIALRGPEVDDSCLALLRGWEGLERLDLAKTGVTAAGLAHLGGLKALKKLDLTGTRVTDGGMAHLKGLPRLEWLKLAGTGVSDAGLADLACLPGLKELILHDDLLGVGNFSGMMNLSNLLASPGFLAMVGGWAVVLEFAELADSSLSECGIRHPRLDLAIMILRLPEAFAGTLLTKLTADPGGSPITDAGLTTLRQAHPGLKVVRTSQDAAP